jgi:hypothetical protein
MPQSCYDIGYFATGRLAQLVRAPALQAGGPRFEPATAHQARGFESVTCSFDP